MRINIVNLVMGVVIWARWLFQKRITLESLDKTYAIVPAYHLENRCCIYAKVAT